jgi:hypothetical protein
MVEVKTTWAGKAVILLFIGACLAGAYTLFFQRDGGSATAGAGGAAAMKEPRTAENADVTFGIAYGTEKRRWLEWALEQYAKTKQGTRVKVELIPMGSLEGAQAILAGDKRIVVWSPASAVYKDVFIQDWQIKHGGEPFVREEALALTPMVFVSWSGRYREFEAKYGEMSFDTVSRALKEKGGWDAIAKKPEWGLFKFGHTHPNQSNSGLVTLVLMAYHHSGKSRGLVLADILDVKFQEWMGEFERAVTGLSNSTGNMMREMVLKGPSSYDAVFVYENVAIDYLENAEGRWGELRISYPKLNLWNENPYYILNAPWATPEQRKAAEAFLNFLLTEPIQKEALVHGFRPGNPSIAIRTAASPFTKHTAAGLRVDLTTIGESPRADVINNLLASWQRSQGSR